MTQIKYSQWYKTTKAGDEGYNYLGTAGRYKYVDKADGTAEVYFEMHPYTNGISHTKTSFELATIYVKYYNPDGGYEYYSDSEGIHITCVGGWNSTFSCDGESGVAEHYCKIYCGTFTYGSSVSFPTPKYTWNEYLYLSVRDETFHQTQGLKVIGTVPYFSNVWIYIDDNNWHRGIPWIYNGKKWKQGSIIKVYDDGEWK